MVAIHATGIHAGYPEADCHQDESPARSEPHPVRTPSGPGALPLPLHPPSGHSQSRSARNRAGYQPAFLILIGIQHSVSRAVTAAERLREGDHHRHDASKNHRQRALTNSIHGWCSWFSPPSLRGRAAEPALPPIGSPSAPGNCIRPVARPTAPIGADRNAPIGGVTQHVRVLSGSDPSVPFARSASRECTSRSVGGSLKS